MIVLALLSGCGGLIPSIPTPAVPAATPVIPTPLLTPLSTSEPVVIEPTLTATPVVTPAPTITPGPSPTMDPLTQIMVSQPARIGALAVSPDGRRAEVLIYDCVAVGDDPAMQQSFELLRIVDVAAGMEYQIDSQLINCGGLGAFGLDILQWSADGRYLFYTPHREGGPDGACRPWARSIVAVNTADWTRTTLDQAAASPDGTKLAGWLESRELVIYGDGGELGRVAAAGTPPNVSLPVWSPDGSALAYLQFSSSCGEAAGESAVALVDAATLESRVLVTQTTPEFESVEWIDQGRLLLTGLLDSGRWVYDLATGQLSPE
jgi:hypothetical protein